MEFLELNELNSSLKEEVFKLWNQEYPLNLHYTSTKDFEEYLAKLHDHFHIILLDEYEGIIGWYFDFLRDNERWFATIINSRFQGMGFGKKLLERAKYKRKILNAWVIESKDYLKANGQKYISPVEFYKKSGFRIHQDIKLENNKIQAIKISWKRGDEISG